MKVAIKQTEIVKMMEKNHWLGSAPEVIFVEAFPLEEVKEDHCKCCRFWPPKQKQEKVGLPEEIVTRLTFDNDTQEVDKILVEEISKNRSAINQLIRYHRARQDS